MKGKQNTLVLYPLRFKEIFVDKVWGGDGLKRVLGKKCGPRTGESWEVAHVNNRVSVIANGAYKGKTLAWLLDKYPREILGDDVYIRHKRFPLLVKFLFAKDRMSLQVHPSDEFVRSYEPEGVGKMEAWYVLSAPPEARVIRGILPGTTESEFRQALDSGNVEECLNKLKVKEGDVIFIPPGTVHSAYGGLMVLELQQASDLTYRFTDWGRNDGARPVDVEKAMRAMDLQSIGVSKLKPSRIPGYPYRRKLLIKCEKFTMELMQLQGGRKVKEKEDKLRCKVFTVIKGGGKLLFGKDRKQVEKFERGQTFVIPAYLGEFDIAAQGATEIVVSYI